MPFTAYRITKAGGIGGHGFEGEFAAIHKAISIGGRDAVVEVARGLNDGGDQVNTIVKHAMQDQMGLRLYRDVTKVMRVSRADVNHLSYDIATSKGGMNIQDFQAVATPAGVRAHVWGVDVTFQRSFVTKSGFLLARRGAERLPIRRLYGPAPYKELLKGEVLRAFDRSVPLLVEPIVMRRVVKLFP